MATNLVESAERQQADAPNNLDVSQSVNVTELEMEFSTEKYPEYDAIVISHNTGRVVGIRRGDKRGVVVLRKGAK